MFSVVIPLYNKEDYIVNTLTSVLNQSYQNFEVIVVNDGSTDDSLKIVQSFHDSRIRVFTKNNGGVSSARNLGVEKANFKYVAFLDADDEWKPDYLFFINKLIDKYPQCALYGAAYKYKADSTVVGSNIKEGIVEDFFQVTFSASILCSSAVVILREVLVDIGGFPVGMVGGEDIYTWCKIAKKYSIVYTPKVLVIYNFQSETGNSRIGKLDTSVEEWIDLFEKDNSYLNEYIAHKAIHSGIRHVLGFHKKKSYEIEVQFSYTKLSRKKWVYLYILNRTPQMLIALITWYRRLFK